MTNDESGERGKCALVKSGKARQGRGMKVHQVTLTVATGGAGMVEVTREVGRVVAASGVAVGTAQVFCQHTSCSLVIMENPDPTARRDLERWLDRLVPEDDADFRHTAEGPDDMPSHIKVALTRTSETVPVSGGRLALGTWQGIFLWEHRRAGQGRRVVVTVAGAE